ncbi:beta-propeller domain-containing protein [Psychrosphaera sp. B3R10]|uniref:beta-propeller domain-containing protein n=1 Tax=unclassified Psychrosphaera TaxID=2641570 RepID=UPI001C08084D|nr:MULTISPECIES: beta-propeller domain-containing protein [unclassified Psychrosphaera]MBU2881569.1 beta-propeller domain-containing protein [Psychrosphaera sp. I2R16]MBU2991176.1 beta-propeller domain-containing protein [Psychrosphaera sp. B3R10]
MTLHSLRIALIFAIGASVTACGSDGLFGSSSKNNVDVEELEIIASSGNRLVKASSLLTEQVVKNGMLLQGNVNRCNECDFTAEASTDVSAPTTGDYSQTTTQESGIDESDRVKYDGDRVYLASNNYYWYETLDNGTDNDESRPHVRILQKNQDDSLTSVSKLMLTDKASNVNDLYVNDNKLMAIYNVFGEQLYSHGFVSDLAMTTDIWYPYKQQFGLTVADVTNAADIQVDVSYTIDGYPISSRRIGNKIYLLSSYSNQTDFVLDTESKFTAQAQYNDFIENNEIQFLPKLYTDGAEQDLVSAEDCYLPSDSTESSGYSSVVTLTTIDLTQPDKLESICVVTPINGFYASHDGLYLYYSGYEFIENENKWVSNTAVHKFDFEGSTVNYSASAEVDGDLGWSNPHLRLSEYNGDLRIVTSSNNWNGTDVEHKLFVLRPDEANVQFNVISSLPNAQQPAKIGKPGESIYAVRYYGDKAYIVTFERRDPLYVVDLSNPESPKLAGELDIPGYSAYLHPINENFIVGIGMQVDPNVNTQSADPNFVSGAKIELYDVSNPNEPVVVDTLVYEDGYSVVEWDYHALSVLKDSDSHYRFSFPVNSWQTIEQQDGSQIWNNNNSLKMVDIDLLQGGSMTQQGSINVDSGYYGSFGDRSILHGDIVYYIRNNSIWQSYWSMPDVLNGPY